MNPDFVIIGAAKSGTSALYDILARHPDVFGSPVKEPNYFALASEPARFRGPGDEDTVNRMSVSDRSEYLRLYGAAPDGATTFEASTMYLSSDVAPGALRRATPDVRLVCVLREPVARAFSSYLHMVRDGREPAPTFRAALDDEPRRIADNWEPLWHYSRLSCYHTHLLRYVDAFPREQIHLVAYDDFRDEPSRVVTELLDFLGLDTQVELDLGTRVNVSGEPRSRHLQRLLVRESVARRLFRRTMPQRIRHRMWNRLSKLNVTPRRRTLDPEDARRLAERFEPEVAALEGMWGRDLSSWRRTWSDGPVSPRGDGQPPDVGRKG